MTQLINMKHSPSDLTTIGDMAIDPMTFVMKVMTADGIKTVTTGAGAMATDTGIKAATFEDNRPTLAEKRLAINISVSDFERLSNNDSGHLMRLINDASEKLRRSIVADTRCGGCPHQTIKVHEHPDMLRAETRHILTGDCERRKPGMTGVVCPDGRATSVKPATHLDVNDWFVEAEPSKPKANPDAPTTAQGDAW